MYLLDQFRKMLPQIEEKIGHLFQDKELLVSAFTHRSFFNEQKGRGGMHNERLEFLGDSILGLIVSDYLYQRLPDHPEGQLSQLRSRIVDAASCAKYLQALGLEGAILLGRGEKISEGQGKISIQANAFEALIAALYLDGGLAAARSFLLIHFETFFIEELEKPSSNYKALLQDFSQKKFQAPPVYQVVKEGGPEHAKMFHVAVLVGGEEAGQGMGHSKKEAEQQAASDALKRWGIG